MGRGTPHGGRGAARNNNNNNNNNYGSNRGGGNRNNKLDVSALGLVSPLGGAGLGTLGALHQTVGVGGLGGLSEVYNKTSLALYSEEDLLLQAVSLTSWLGCVHSWEDRSHTT